MRSIVTMMGESSRRPTGNVTDQQKFCIGVLASGFRYLPKNMQNTSEDGQLLNR